MMRSRAVAIAIALGLAACSGGSSGSSLTAKEAAQNGKRYIPPKTVATSATTTTTPVTLPQKPADAIALATRLGCDHPEADTSSTSIDISGLPKPTGSVSCTLSDGTDINVDTYTTDGIKALKGSKLQGFICSLALGFGETGPFYTTVGADFTVDVNSDAPDNDPNYHARSQAIADALGVPLTTIKCEVG
jgi:hypothetical protein